MKRLLVIVDMQNDFITGSLGTAEARAIVPKVCEKIRRRLSEGWDLAFTMDTHGEDYRETQEGRRLPVVHCVKGTKGWELCPELSGYSGRVFEKGAFGSRRLAAWAEEEGYGQIELSGLCTDICVISNALLLKAFLPEAEIRVDPACCAGVTPESHSNAIDAMRLCQVEIG